MGMGFLRHIITLKLPGRRVQVSDIVTTLTAEPNLAIGGDKRITSTSIFPWYRPFFDIDSFHGVLRNIFNWYFCFLFG